MPDEDPETRRRIRAAMALAGLESWEALAAATGYSRTTLKELGTERKSAQRRHLIAIATACDVPLEWFSVPSIAAAVAAFTSPDAESAGPLPPGEVRPGVPRHPDDADTGALPRGHQAG